MLQDRSKRFAGIDGDIHRLTLVSNGQLVLVVVLVVILLIAIFPRKALVEKLYGQESLDELTLSYIQNLYRADPRNADLALLLARSQQESLELKELEELLIPLATNGDKRQKPQAITMLVDRYKGLLDARIGATLRAQVLASAKELLKLASQGDLPKPLALTLSDFAFEIDLPQLGLMLFTKVEGTRSVKALEMYAQSALAEGNHSMAGEFFFLAQAQSKDPTEARRLFKQGVETLMADGLYDVALQSVRVHLGDLENDPETLRLVIRVAMAANNPPLAAEFGRKLLFKPNQSKAVP